MVSFLDDLKSYTKKQTIILGQSDYMIDFNGTGTKMVIVCQPVVPLDYDASVRLNDKSFEGSVADYVQQQFAMTSTQIKAC